MTQAAPRTIALIGGTGLAAGLRQLPLTNLQVYRNVQVEIGSQVARTLEYLEGTCGDLRVILLPRHGPTLERPDRSPAGLVQELGHEAHIWLLYQLGVSAVYAFSTVGALDLDVPLASSLTFVVPDRYARGIGATVHSFGPLAREIHPSLSPPFCEKLRDQAIAAIRTTGATALTRGLYIYDGPDQFETDVEIRALQRLYAGEPYRMVGMTAGPELALCRQMGLPYVVICSNSNYAQGVRDETAVTHAGVLAEMKPASEKLLEIAAELIRGAARAPS
jgi:5'-methylthioinosine phosphorylase